MDTESNGAPLAIWREQEPPPVPPRLAMDELRRRSRELDLRVRWRNGREYLAGALVAGVFGYYLWSIPSALARAGSALSIAGILVVIRSLHRRSSAAGPEELALSPCLAFYLRQLERQRDLLRSVWRWYLAPLVPGLVVFLAGLLARALEAADARAHMPAIIAAFSAVAVGCVLAFVVVERLNSAVARRLQREIDALAVLVGP